MNDITALAQRMKAAAISAKELGAIARYSKGRAAIEAFIGLATPDNFLALVEALESRTITVTLPKRSVGEVMHMSGFDRQYAEGWCSGNDNAINEMKLAGIQVIEGEG